MRRSRIVSSSARARRLIALGLAAALVFAACGGDDDDGVGTGDTTEDGTADGADGDGALTDSFRGVTAESIKVGIVIIDYQAIADFVDFNRGPQQEIAQVFVEWINENGGVLGRRIEPVFVEYPPIPGREPSPLAICTQLTEDEEVFAILGVFIDFSGDGQLCVSRDHNTIHIGHELEQRWIDEADPALLLTPDSTKEARAESLIRLLEEEGTLEGRKVAVLADDNAQALVDGDIVPKLEEIGADLGSTAILTITGTDTSAAQAQLESFIERWKTEGVDTVFISGLTASAKQFVERIKAEIPDALLIVDASSVIQQGQDLTAAGTVPNPYEGLISIEGETRSQRWADKNELLAECVRVYEEATGETILGPDEVTPGPDGKVVEIYVAVEDFCGELVMLETIAEQAGAELTNETWSATVDAFGPIDLVTSNIASLCEGKYAADDAVQLVEFDPTLGERGDWRPISEISDGSGGRCADG